MLEINQMKPVEKHNMPIFKAKRRSNLNLLRSFQINKNKMTKI